MPISKIKTSSIVADAASVNLNIDAGTLYLDAANNYVGVNNTVPTASLEVKDIVKITGTGTPMLRINTTSSGDQKGQVQWMKSGTAKYSVGTDINATGANNFYIYDEVGSSSRMVIDPSGYVALGSGFASPTRPVHLAGPDSRNYFKAETTNNSVSYEAGFEVKTPTSNFLIGSWGNTNALWIYDSIATRERFRIAGNGLVTLTGYDTGTNPLSSSYAARLNLVNSYNSVAGNGSSISFQSNSGTNPVYASIAGWMQGSAAGGAYGDLVFGTKADYATISPLDRMRITSAGYVGIGGISATSTLHVAGVNLGNSTTDASYVATFDSGAGQSSVIRLRYNASNTNAISISVGSNGSSIQASSNLVAIRTNSNLDVNTPTGSATIFNDKGLWQGPNVRYNNSGKASSGSYSSTWAYCPAETMISPDGDGLVSIVRNGVYGGAGGISYDIFEHTNNYGWQGGWFVVEVYAYGYFETASYRKYYIGGGYQISAYELTTETFGTNTNYGTLTLTRTGGFANGTRSTPSSVTDGSYYRYTGTLNVPAYCQAKVKITYSPGFAVQSEDTDNSGQIKLI